MQNFSISKATKEQMSEIATVFEISFRKTYPNFIMLHTEKDLRSFFEDIVYVKNYVYVAKSLETGRILGFIAYSHDFIDQLYLLPDCQRQGLGTELINIAKQNSKKLSLWTFQQNIKARAFYKNQGFSEIKLTDGSENEEKQPAVFLEWRNFRP